MPTVLLVDDDDTFRTDLADVFTGAGFEVKEANDGEAGCNLYQGGEAIDVILVDQVMPGKTGFEMIQQLSQKIKDDHTIVIFHTANADKELRSASKELEGVKGWVIKPTASDLLIKTVNLALAKRKKKLAG